jgi:hypothetical protein
MNRLTVFRSLLFSLLALMLTVQPGLAAPHIGRAAEVVALDETGIEFRVAWENDAYAIYMRPNVTPDGLNFTLTSQVTIKVRHGIGADRFEVNNLQSTVAGAEWAQTSRVDAPVENSDVDYISFTVNFVDGDHSVYQWAEGQELKIFTFTNSGACLGAVSLLENDEVFAQSGNSANTNPGNQIDVLGINRNNAYTGNYGGAATCTDDNPRLDAVKLYMPLIQR